MHLSYSISKYKEHIYKSYAIAESYREGKNVRKRIIWSIGKLTDRQASQIKLICKVAQSEEQVIAHLKGLVVKETKSYLDIAVVDAIWKEWKFDEAFKEDVTNSQLPTHTIAKILTINRCTDPCSHYSIPTWAKKNAIEEVLKIDISGLNDDKIYYELEKIHKNKVFIEKHFFEKTYRESPESYEFIDYDLTTSYFVGYRCTLSAFGKGKKECHGRRQILLGVLINDDGYPFKWDVFAGNTAEVKTLKQNIEACRDMFGIDNGKVTMVFDRGIISEKNAELIDATAMKYISALDKNQISSSGINLEPFKKISEDKVTKEISIPEGFKKYDDNLYFHECGVIGEKRFIVGFNPVLYKEDRNNREEKIETFRKYLEKENNLLKNAQRDREPETTKNRISNELNRLKLKKYYEKPVLSPITVEKKLKNGEIKLIRSFHVEVNIKKNVIDSEKLLDGVCVFVTNHIEKLGQGYKMKPQRIINAYRNKTKIEDVFKNIKSFLKLRPFFVNTETHVEAVYTVCMMGYFINRYLANKRKEIEKKDYLNSKELYAPFRDIDIATLEDKSSGYTIKKGVVLSQDTEKLIQNLGMSHVVFSQ